MICRRDYSGLFDAVASNKELASAGNFTLRLIGRGDMAVPASLHGRVIKETNLAYKVRCPILLDDHCDCRIWSWAAPLLHPMS